MDRDAAARLAEARAFEAAHDLPGAFDAYQAALVLAPDSLDIVQGLAGLAFRLRHWELAERFYVHLITHGQQDMVTVTAFAATLREQGRHDEAIDLLKSLLGQHPQEPRLWEALGSLMATRGDTENAVIFLSEALRLNPNDTHARFNRGCALMDQGAAEAGLADLGACINAFVDPDNRASADIAYAQALLSVGDLTNGWHYYKGRERIGTTQAVGHGLTLPRLDNTQSLANKNLFVCMEQGLGDEVLFASLLPDIQREMKPDGRLGLGVEPRLVSLFQRSFPEAVVTAHRTQIIDGKLQRSFPDFDQARFDGWALIGDFLCSHRASLAQFPAVNAYLKPDPARIQHWRAQMAAIDNKPKIGLLWKSLKGGAQRDRYFSAFAQWADILALEGLTFVNLQYGDTAEEMRMARAAGLHIHTPEGIDLKDDLDDLAALCASMDVILGPSNATTNIAAAAGLPVWLLSAPVNWLRLGESHYPWYPSARLFPTPSLADWSPALDAMRDALIERFGL